MVLVLNLSILLEVILQTGKKRISINHIYSSCLDVTYDVTQGYILDSLLLNIDICDMFLSSSSFYIASYADGNTPYISVPTKDLVKPELEICCTNLFKRFRGNHLKSNPDKCHLLVTSRKPVRINLEGHIIHNSTEEKLCLGLKLIHNSCLKVMRF